MNRTKIAVFLTGMLNLVAAACLIFFAVPYLTHDTSVPNPEAMLPMARWDGAGMALTFGLPPMLAANFLGFRLLFPKEQPLLLRLMCFLPAAAEIGLVIHYWVISLT